MKLNWQNQNGRMAEWQDGIMEDWQDGRMAEWQNGMALLGHRRFVAVKFEVKLHLTEPVGVTV